VELAGKTATEDQVLSAGALTLYERNAPLGYSSDHVRQLFLILPYADSRGALGGMLSEPVLSLDKQPLAPFIRSQMMLLDVYAGQLSVKAISSILDSLYRVSLLMLADMEQHTSVMRVLQEVRLKSAKFRLENFAEERIDAIAYLCGFSSPVFSVSSLSCVLVCRQKHGGRLLLIDIHLPQQTSVRTDS